MNRKIDTISYEVLVFVLIVISVLLYCILHPEVYKGCFQF